MLMMQYCIPRNSEAQRHNKLMCHWEFQFKRSFMRKWGRLITPAHFMYSKYYFSLLNTIPFPYPEYTRNISKKWRESGSYLTICIFNTVCFVLRCVINSSPEGKFHKGKHLCLFASLYPYYLEHAWHTEGTQLSIIELMHQNGNSAKEGCINYGKNILKTWICHTEFYSGE